MLINRFNYTSWTTVHQEMTPADRPKPVPQSLCNRIFWSRRSAVALFFVVSDRLRLICSVLGASKFAVLKLIEIVILCVYYTTPSGFSFFRTFGTLFFNLSTTFFG